ncbi:hypothetical protein BIU82_06930 [Arthrobacter sp. SW1]|uniref:hypothetical protein n=1 Tax=Arthrobacter sp. SW1 TaxID=1920889 RepID=UPI000877DB0C|nr:hypothetical protein [Arthrobacter sp. SW1]OFI37612.1 hypothetical protein BIU82_06930 [Arthrobacter sp. SW1]
MNTSLRLAAAGAGLMLTAVLAACGMPQAAPGTAPSGSPVIGTVSETPTPAPSVTAAPTAESKAFTFTTEKLSLRYPKEWTVKTDTFPFGTVTAETAAFTDAAGKAVLAVSINSSTYDYAWPVQRTVIESGALPGLASGDWNPPMKYAFYVEEPQSPGGPGAVCTASVLQKVPNDGLGQLRGLPVEGPTPVPSPMPEDQSMPYFIGFELAAEVEKCGSVAGAKAWWASAQGQQAKAVLLSLTAS